MVGGVTSPHTAVARPGDRQEVAVENIRGNDVAVVTTPGTAGEEMIVGTAGVRSAGSFSLLTGVRLQTAWLTTVVLRVPQSSLPSEELVTVVTDEGDGGGESGGEGGGETHRLVTVVETTDQALVTVRVLLAVSLPLPAHPHLVPHTASLSSPALHLQPLGCLGVHHDGQRGLPRAGVLQDREAGQLAGLSAGVVVETIADFLQRLPVETPLGTTKNTETWHGLRQRLRETPSRDISG